MALTRRQKETLDFVKGFIESRGYSPSLEEVAGHFRLNSIATVHKHICNLQEKGYLKRDWNRSRSIELLPTEVNPTAVALPLLGRIAAGAPLEAIEEPESIAVPEELLGSRGGRRGELYVLQVRGDSMIDEQIRDGDYVIVESRADALNGETVVALINHEHATLKKFYRENGRIRLQPANETMKPIYVDEGDVTIRGVVIAAMRRY